MPVGRIASCRGQKVPRFADPWRFRDRAKWVEPTVDLRGRPIQPRFYCRSGVNTFSSLPDSSDDPVEVSRSLPQRSSLAALRRRKAATFARYRLAGWCTAVELSTIDALWFEGVSLRQLAKREGVTPAAISDRIAGLRHQHKAQEFSNWWRLKNYSRQRHPR